MKLYGLISFVRSHRPQQSIDGRHLFTIAPVHHSMGCSMTMDLPYSSDDRIEPEMVAILAGKTESQRLQIGWNMWSAARRMMTRVVRAEHPDWQADQIEVEVSRRMSDATG